MAFRDAGIDHVADPAAWMGENQVSKRSGIGFGQPMAYPCSGIFEQFPDRVDYRSSPGCGCCNCIEHKEYPLLPGLPGGNLKQITIVAIAVVVDEAAQEDYGYFEQLALHQVDQIQRTSRPAVAVGKRVDRLELVVHDRKADQRIDQVILADEALPIG